MLMSLLVLLMSLLVLIAVVKLIQSANWVRRGTCSQASLERVKPARAARVRWMSGWVARWSRCRGNERRGPAGIATNVRQCRAGFSRLPFARRLKPAALVHLPSSGSLERSGVLELVRTVPSRNMALRDSTDCDALRRSGSGRLLLVST